MELIAVIDTETTWNDLVMSIGTVVTRGDNFQALDAKYHVLTPEMDIGGMYENALFVDGMPRGRICSRLDALAEIRSWLESYGVQRIFAYNAGFDKGHLPELSCFSWHDIMRLAAYRQTNPCIPACSECFSTGRLKRGYGVEAMFRLLSGDHKYREVHNALCDAVDELKIMAMMGRAPQDYPLL